MAEIALGGMSFVGKRGQQLARCPHTETLTATTAGVERIVCESCGHLSFNFPKVLSGPVHRRRFARPADDVGAPQPADAPMDDWLARSTPEILTSHDDAEAVTAAQAFAAQERFHIRSRYELHPASAAVA
jgi:hypothetical protein